MNKGPKALASQLARYMRYRSAKEGTTSTLTGKDIYKAALSKGVTSVFGIDVRPGYMRCDSQNPVAFRSWFTEFPHEVPPEMILVKSRFLGHFTLQEFEHMQASVMDTFLSGKFDCGHSVVMLDPKVDNWITCAQTIQDAIEYVREK